MRRFLAGLTLALGSGVAGMLTGDGLRTYFEAVRDGANLRVIMADVGADGKPIYARAREFTMTPAAASDASVTPAGAPSPAASSAGNPLAGGNAAPDRFAGLPVIAGQPNPTGMFWVHAPRAQSGADGCDCAQVVGAR